MTFVADKWRTLSAELSDNGDETQAIVTKWLISLAAWGAACAVAAVILRDGVAGLASVGLTVAASIGLWLQLVRIRRRRSAAPNISGDLKP